MTCLLDTFCSLTGLLGLQALATHGGDHVVMPFCQPEINDGGIQAAVCAVSSTQNLVLLPLQGSEHAFKGTAPCSFRALALKGLYNTF